MGQDKQENSKIVCKFHFSLKNQGIVIEIAIFIKIANANLIFSDYH